jgi:hypothetical protein
MNKKEQTLFLSMLASFFCRFPNISSAYQHSLPGLPAGPIPSGQPRSTEPSPTP